MSLSTTIFSFILFAMFTGDCFSSFASLKQGKAKSPFASSFGISIKDFISF